jgi:hypothetical protein
LRLLEYDGNGAAEVSLMYRFPTTVHAFMLLHRYHQAGADTSN